MINFSLSNMLTVMGKMMMLRMKAIKFYFHFSDAGCVSSVEQMVGTRVSSGGGGFSNSFLLRRTQSGQK